MVPVRGSSSKFARLRATALGIASIPPVPMSLSPVVLSLSLGSFRFLTLELNSNLWLELCVVWQPRPVLKYLLRPSGPGPGRRLPVPRPDLLRVFSGHRPGRLRAARSPWADAGGRMLASVGYAESLDLGPGVMEGRTVGDSGRYPSGRSGVRV